MVQIAPSILAADFARLGEEVAQVEAAGADLLHVDVMDGHFVPNLTIGPPVIKALDAVTRLPLDVHLMVQEPDALLPAFIEAGSDNLTVHVEACRHLHRTIQIIKEAGVHASVVLNPATPLYALEEILPELHMVLLMSVNPGFGGQTFIPRSESKVREVRALLDSVGSRAPVEIDGGIDQHNVGRVVAAGAGIIVAGSAVFHQPDPERATRELKAAALGAAIPSAAR